MRITLLLFAFVALVGCQQKKIDRMQAVQDSLAQVAEVKDVAINDFIGTMNAIQTNLDSIKRLEDIVNISSSKNAEPKASDRQKILQDLSVISSLLEQNRELVANQTKKLNNSTYKVSEMQKMLDRMNRQLEEKDVEIATLRTEMEQLHLNISTLNQSLLAAEEQAEEQARVIEEKTTTIDEQVKQMNTAYYVFGTAKELIENGIVEREGGFLGLGRSLKFRKDFNPDLFTEIDVREVHDISLNAKKAKVITTHPAASFDLIGDEKIEKLVINDPERFWETNRYLVLVVN